MVRDGERLAREDAERVAQVEARNELEAELFRATELATATNNILFNSTVVTIRGWLEEAAPNTAVTAYKAKLFELQTAMARATPREARE